MTTIKSSLPPPPHSIPIEDSDSLIEEIDLFLDPDDSIPPGIESDDYDSEGDILFLEELLSNDSLPETESFHFDHYDVPASPCPLAKPPDDGIFFDIEPDQAELTSVVMEDILGEPRVHVPNVLPTHPTLMMDSDFIPSDDSLNPGIFFEVQSKRFLSRDTFSISFIRNPLCPVIETLVPFSSENEDKVFNPGILSSNLLSHRGKITSDFSKSPMMISGGDIPFLDDCPDYEDSRARGFSILHMLIYGNLIS
ncbi:hypothetical protein Tco_0877258 [Tanacetum coccineum]|uniref:Reverse transcriptase domain-containing protein n=1 Tax=Tanacetum coccineum TaxID=301880 RepID=A0ABQ5BXM7_9ASTR